MVSHLRWHGIGNEFSIFSGDSLGYLSRGDIARQRCALREPAENDLGVGTVRRRRFDVQTRIPDAVDDGSGEFDPIAEIAAGDVVDRIDVHRFRAGLRAHGVDERLSHPANARWLAGAPREHDLDIGATWGRRGRLGRGEWDWCAQQCCAGHEGCAEQPGEMVPIMCTPLRCVIPTPCFLPDCTHYYVAVSQLWVR